MTIGWNKAEKIHHRSFKGSFRLQSSPILTEFLVFLQKTPRLFVILFPLTEVCRQNMPAPLEQAIQFVYRLRTGSICNRV